MEKKHVTTENFAEIAGVKSSSIRRSLCVNGHYLGIKPLKLSNHRLLWPMAEIGKILSGNTCQQGA